MDPLVTPQELITFLQDDIDLDVAQLAVKVASGMARGYAGWQIDEADEVLVRDGTGTTVLTIPRLNLSDVAVAEGREPVALVDDEDFEWSADGILTRLGGVWRRRARWYRVEVSSGFPEGSAELESARAVVLRVAARGAANPEALRQVTIGRYSETVGGENSGISLYKPDRLELDEVRIP